MNRIVIWVMICNALVAVAAFLKDVLLARYVGTTSEADAFTVAYFITDTIASSWLAASLGAAGVTVYAKMSSENAAVSRNEIWNKSALLFFALGLASTVLLMLATAALLPPGLLRTLTNMMAPTIVIFSLFAALSARLQAANRFVVPAAAPLIMHGTFLAAAVFVTLSGMPEWRGLQWIAFSVTAGAFGTLLFTAIAGRKPESEHKEAGEPADASVRNRWLKEIWKIFGAYSVLVISGQAVLFWERALAASLDVGVVSSLNYAYRISQVPVWIFATAAASVMLPKLSKLWMDNRLDEARKYTIHMLQLVFIVSLPVMLSLWLLSEPVVAVLFQRGAFRWHSVLLTSDMLRGYAFSLLGHSVSAIFIRYWLASGKTVQPACLVLISTLATVVFQLALVNRIGASGIGYGAAAGATLQGVLLAIPLLKNKKVPFRAGNVRAVVPAAVSLCLVLIAALYFWKSFSLKESEGPRIAFLFITFAFGFSVYTLFVRKIIVRIAGEENST